MDNLDNTQTKFNELNSLVNNLKNKLNELEKELHSCDCSSFTLNPRIVELVNEIEATKNEIKCSQEE